MNLSVLEQLKTTVLILLLYFIPSQTSKPFNVLFVISDDLRADIGGYYGQNDIVYTPNINAFQAASFTFTHAYTQQSVCSASRTSFLTGLRPDTTRVWWNGPYFRNEMINGTGKNVITLPQYFKEYGNYYTVGSGKTFHPGTASGGDGECFLGDDMPYSWTSYWDCVGSVANAKVNSPAQNKCVNGTGCTQSQQCLDCLAQWNCYNPNGTNFVQLMCPADCDDNCFQDADVADQTLRYFKSVTSNETLKNKPFFIAAGLRRPHVGFFAPLRYYEQYGYNNNYSNIEIAKHRQPPYNMPFPAYLASVDEVLWDDVKPHIYAEEYLNPADGKNYTIKLINDSFHSHIRGGYYSSISFMDAQFGRIIQGLFEYNLWNNTIVVFIGDHGYHLGEQGHFAKGTNFEVAARVPLMIRIPGLNEGMKSDVLIEMLDIYPTLIDATIGFNDNIKKQLQGKSVLNLIKDPSMFINYYAYSQFNRTINDESIMGVSMRTTQWRYTEWVGFNPGSIVSEPSFIWNVSYGVELYNHSNNTIDENDMNAYDNYNLAYNDDMKSIINQLHDQLYKTWDNQSWAINY
eukprot:168483_1